MIRTAQITKDGMYRWSLTREWDYRNDRKQVCFLMLNPSTADGTVDDHTIRKCIGFATRWGYGALTVVNLFAYRSTDPRALKTVQHPVGYGNHIAINREAAKADKVVCAWGCSQHTKGLEELMGFGVEVAKRAARGKLYCLGRAKDGTPRHPLMLPYSTELEPYVV